MANRRPNSCPVDPWKLESDFSDDRPKSVLRRQDKDESKSEDILDPEITARASENTDLNRAKVNQWIDLKSKDKEKTDPNASGGSKLFHHYPQRRVSPAVASESSGMTRPQTEPGRTRTQMFSDDVKNLVRQSVHDVANASAGTGTEKEEPEEGWVMVEKSTSDTVMPCDSDDESNVLVPTPNKESEQTNENLENEKRERTKMILANKFGTTFKVLPEARDKATSGTGGESSGTSGAEGKSMSVTAAQPGKSSMRNILTFATSISKWKQRRGTAVGFATLHPEHRALLQAESDNMKTEIPEAMMRTIKEEAYKIVLKTTQTYKSQIGSKHRMTIEAYENLKELRDELLRTECSIA